MRWRRRCQAVALSGKGVEGDALRDAAMDAATSAAKLVLAEKALALTEIRKEKEEIKIAIDKMLTSAEASQGAISLKVAADIVAMVKESPTMRASSNKAAPEWRAPAIGFGCFLAGLAAMWLVAHVHF